MPDFKPDRRQLTKHLMIPKAPRLDSFGRKKLVPHLVAGALVGKAVAAAIVEKIVVNTGGVKPSYLGPPESFQN